LGVKIIQIIKKTGKKFKSWYILSLGMVIQFLLGFILFIIPSITVYKHAIRGLSDFFIGSMLLIGIIIGIIPLILLYLRKTRKIGGIVSIIFGIISYMIFPLWIIISIFLVIAGIIALWKKV